MGSSQSFEYIPKTHLQLPTILPYDFSQECKLRETMVVEMEQQMKNCLDKSRDVEKAANVIKRHVADELFGIQNLETDGQLNVHIKLWHDCEMRYPPQQKVFKERLEKEIKPWKVFHFSGGHRYSDIFFERKSSK